MGILMSELKAGVKAFDGISPNSSTMPLGQIKLPVTFGMPDNFHTDRLTFDIVGFKTTYNVILGRPMLDKFIAMVHYAYQTLKIPSPKGVITIRGDQPEVVKCDKQSLDIVKHLSRVATTPKGMDSMCQKHQATIEIKDSKLVSLVDISKSNDATKGETNENASNKNTDGGVKAMPLDLSKPTKTVKVGANLDSK
ncbi:uncharacterized protein LOC133925598 [Phragmites australis]|uniref:uncharacterized protein LOC133925598 n=1 Tax=Phragmites australis TaxID=29695 RepID=UPI002D76D562|nr:uncharacterized protein LOC133925598 [Phragmites australis]